jgi:hypothetical protein
LAQSWLAERYDEAPGLGKEGAWRPKLLPAAKSYLTIFLYDTSIRNLRFTSTPDIMSRASQITLATTCLGAIGIVIAVHYGQVTEKAVS